MATSPIGIGRLAQDMPQLRWQPPQNRSDSSRGHPSPSDKTPGGHQTRSVSAQYRTEFSHTECPRRLLSQLLNK